MDLGISERVALVSGGSEGLGFACARALAAEGARVAICARREDVLRGSAQRITDETGTEALPIPCDVTRLEDIERAVATTVKRFGGRLDILVNNAGGPPFGHPSSIDLDRWEQGYALTFRSMVAFCHEAIPHLRENGWGRIITITSTSVKEPIDGLTISNAMRPAVHGFAKSLSREIGKDNITVNCVCPGPFLTQRHRDLLPQWAAEMGCSPDELLAQREANVPLRRFGQPEELGRVVAFLASEAAGFVNGVSLPVDGGLCKGLL